MSNMEEQSFDTPNIEADQATLLVHSTIRIAAPASMVFRTLRNTETWKDWNRFVPRVNITYQPPDEDLTTSAEIEELVRNTSIAGSYDSDLTDGMVGSGSFKQKLSENGERPSTPPLRLRMGSQASRGSQRSGSEDGILAVSPPTNSASLTVPNGNDTKPSAAQKFATSQAERKASVASGHSLPPVQNNLVPATAANLRSANSSRRASLAPPEGQGRRKSKTPSLQKEMKARQASLNLLYGEPSIRLQLNTRMTFYIRMNPHNPREYKQTHFVVSEVSRPDDPLTEGSRMTQLTRSKTHTLNRQAVYRIVWGMDNTMSSMLNMKNGSAFPKSLLVTERVHEIRPITLGNGTEECELRTWELQKGPLAKVVKKKFGDYLQQQFDLWAKNLGEFCEGLIGKGVDRRDFSIVVDDDANPVGIITF